MMFYRNIITLLCACLISMPLSCFNEISTGSFLEGAFIPNPKIASIQALSSTMLTLSFDQDMAVDGIDTQSNYVITDSAGNTLLIQGIRIIPETQNRDIEITTVQQRLREEYAITITNVSSKQKRDSGQKSIQGIFYGYSDTPPPQNLAYSEPNVLYAYTTPGTAITPNTPTVTGTVDEYTITPQLPLGLDFEPATGIICGIPLIAAEQTTYTVKASNSGGDTYAAVVITVLSNPAILDVNTHEINMGSVYWLEGSPQLAARFEIKNDGDKSINWIATSDTSWITIAPHSDINLAGGTTQTVTLYINPAGLSEGTYAASIQVTALSDECLNDKHTIQLAFSLFLWKNKELIETIPYMPLREDIRYAHDTNDNALLYWESDYDSVNRFCLKQHKNNLGWQETMYVDNGADQSDEGRPECAFDQNGNAICVWAETSAGADYHIYAKKYNAQTGWEETMRIDEEDGDASRPQIVFDLSGNATVVWIQADSDDYIHLYTKRYSEGVWGTPQAHNSGNIYTNMHSIDADDSGNVFIAWENSGFIYARRYAVANGTWSSSQQLSTSCEFPDCSLSYNPKIAADKNNNAFVFWEQTIFNIMGSPVESQMYAARFDISSNAWQSTARVDNAALPNSNSIENSFALSKNGNAIAVWVGPLTRLYANYYEPGSGWGGPARIDSSDLPIIGSPVAKFDTSDTAYVFWSQYHATGSIYLNRHAPGSGWQQPEPLLSSPYAFVMKIIFDNENNGLVIGYDLNNKDILANYYAPQSGWSGFGKVAQMTDMDFVNVYHINGAFKLLWIHREEMNYSIYSRDLMVK